MMVKKVKSKKGDIVIDLVKMFGKPVKISRIALSGGFWPGHTRVKITKSDNKKIELKKKKR